MHPSTLVRPAAGTSPGDGALAQLVAHLLCKQGVRGSSPLGSTNGSAPSAEGAVRVSGAQRQQPPPQQPPAFSEASAVAEAPASSSEAASSV